MAHSVTASVLLRAVEVAMLKKLVDRSYQPVILCKRRRQNCIESMKRAMIVVGDQMLLVISKRQRRQFGQGDAAPPLKL